MRVLIFGGRDFTDARYMKRILDMMARTEPFDVVIHGGYRGADTLAGRWGASNHSEVIVFKAEWEKYKGAAGPIRNKRMLDEGVPDLAIGFGEGDGTDNMYRQARKAGVEVRRFWPPAQKRT